MSEPAKKPGRQPESYSPKGKPEILKLAERLNTAPTHMIEIQNVHLEYLPPLQFIGKRCTRRKGGYGAHWQEWFDKDWFAPLVALPEVPGVETGYIGLMRCDGVHDKKGRFPNFEYWIGTMDLPESPVPPGYESIDLPASPVGVCWLRGRVEDGIYGQHNRCEEAVKAQGQELHTDPRGFRYFFERYNGERFYTPDEEGRVILDYGIYVK